MIEVDYPKLLDNFKEHLDPKRSESASFLIWYLEEYYRLDTQEAVDAVCDQSGDKGVDGIYVNDNDQTITIFQSKISHKAATSIGDAPLRDFLGTLQQFSNKTKVEHLVKTAGNAQVASLIKRADLINKLSTHEVRGEFLVNVDLDGNGKAFLAGQDDIYFIGKSELVSSYISGERDLPKQVPAKFDVLGIEVGEHVVDVERKAIIAPIRARELVALSGIADQSLFAFNVRGPLGRTKVNKDMIASIRNNAKHKLFPLFHNGITIIAKDVLSNEESIEINDYYVVNGCQSISTLYNNKSYITDDLRVLTKIIKLDPLSAEAKMITEYSNNQNSVRSRDFKSNHQIQIRLQSEFKKSYNDVFYYEIKRGEVPGGGDVISNEIAGLYLLAFDLKEPWATHRKYEVFEDKHSALFGRPEVTADRIVLCQMVAKEIEKRLGNLNNQLYAKHVITKYMILFAVREYFEGDEKFDEYLQSPGAFMRNKGNREKFSRCVGSFIDEIIIDLNMESKDWGDDFDYRDKLRDQKWVKSTVATLVKEYQKQKARGKSDTFGERLISQNPK